VNISWYKRSQQVENNALSSTAEPQLIRILPFGYVAMLVLITQIMLGGWTSTNYAAAVCYQLPFCESGWTERFSVASALSLPLGHETYEYGVLPYEARMSIHVLHRIGAIVTLLVLGSFVFISWRRATTKSLRRIAAIIAGLLLLQLALGLVNVVAQLPLLIAVAHNVVAANLLMTLMIFLRQIYLRRTLSVDDRQLIHAQNPSLYIIKNTQL
jgi:cytochrome c oxidase assembly protein subunit 15